MENRILKYFVAVAEELSFTRAAKRLHIAQPSLGQQIRQLEAAIGAPLLVREGHHLQLTEAGRTLLHEARNIIVLTERAVVLTRQAAKTEAGLLTIAMVAGPENKLFSTVFAAMFRQYPGVQIVLRTLTGPEQLDAIRDHAIDIGFLRGPIELEDGLVSEIIVREDMIALLPADRPLARQKRIDIRTLAAALPLVDISEAVAPALHRAIHRIAANAGVRFNTIMVVESITATLNAIASGLGFSLHCEYVRQITPKNVVVRPLDVSPVPQLDLVVVYRRNDRRAALEFFLKSLRESQECNVERMIRPPDGWVGASR
ncbi:MAG: LysR family transcriptional regulator [Rhodoplanes sp.]|uniref:LysR substrate-binding domain-containing protein n=1 Tax=Rhodoplanes sp. TaxID=1968906 RepID=UPI0017BAF1ED|nr:LysR substrate-binding domain-containing protein [Rhodoplanes sp.]NVO14806.1 LysR family transcriptional regulator [Rhodoplanes sp.]